MNIIAVGGIMSKFQDWSSKNWNSNSLGVFTKRILFTSVGVLIVLIVVISLTYKVVRSDCSYLPHLRLAVSDAPVVNVTLEPAEEPLVLKGFSYFVISERNHTGGYFEDFYIASSGDSLTVTPTRVKQAIIGCGNSFTATIALWLAENFPMDLHYNCYLNVRSFLFFKDPQINVAFTFIICRPIPSFLVPVRYDYITLN